MHAMTRRRIAFLALLAMAWAALLPFTASARMLLSDGPVEHCHRLSIDSVIDPDPVAPEGPSQPRKATCPFCASGVAAAPPPHVVVPAFVALQPPDVDFPFIIIPATALRPLGVSTWT